MIGLFGGSFDPIHHGHLLVAQALVESLGLDELRFLPANEQPFKRGRHHAAPAHRSRMVELAIEGAAGFRLERCELERPGPSYTVDTLRALGAREPGQRWVLFLGSDAAAELSGWKEAGEVARLARVVAFVRPGARLNPSPLVSGVVPVPAVGISATTIRSRVRAGLSIRYWVPQPVAAYIAAERLYL
ncbi:MAG: nicotinate-nucleotide adenylyltransferase [Gemmatimonadales bacterium]